MSESDRRRIPWRVPRATRSHVARNDAPSGEAQHHQHNHNKDQAWIKKTNSIESAASINDHNIDTIFEREWAELGFATKRLSAPGASEDGASPEKANIRKDDELQLDSELDRKPKAISEKRKAAPDDETISEKKRTASDALDDETDSANCNKRPNSRKKNASLQRKKSKGSDNTDTTNSPNGNKPEGPQRPLSAYNLFFRDFRRQLIENSGGPVPFVVMGKEVGKTWKTLNKEERKKWEEKAELESQRYQREVSALKAKEREAKRLRRATSLENQGSVNSSSTPSNDLSATFTFKSEPIHATPPGEKQVSENEQILQHGRELAFWPPGFQVPTLYPPSGSFIPWPEPRTGEVQLHTLHWKLYSVPIQHASSFVRHMKHNLFTSGTSPSVSVMDQESLNSHPPAQDREPPSYDSTVHSRQESPQVIYVVPQHPLYPAPYLQHYQPQHPQVHYHLPPPTTSTASSSSSSAEPAETLPNKPKVTYVSWHPPTGNPWTGVPPYNTHAPRVPGQQPSAEEKEPERGASEH